MKVEAKINRKLDENYVQVEVCAKNTNPRYFKVPKEKADEFCKEYIKNDKKMNNTTNIMFVGSALLGSALGQLATYKVKSKAIKLSAGVLGALAGTIGSIYASIDILDKKGNEFLARFNAEQIFKEQQKTVADIINKKPR